MTGTLTHLNCTQCGAGLDVLGGGRVQTHICPYCGSELDAQDDYKVITQFRDMERPNTPFDIGQVGDLWGVEFTIIGTMAWTEYYAGKSWVWVDHQIYSPTHGYAWLTVEDGWVTFVRKSRDIPSPAFVSKSKIDHSENRPVVKLGGENFRYYASGRAKPTYIEGEFNFRPSMDDTMDYVSFLGGERMLDIVSSAGEREYEVSTLPDQAAVIASFGVASERRPRPRGVNPMQSVSRSPMQLYLRNLCLAAAVISALIGVVLMGMGKTIAESSRTSISGKIDLPFTVTDGGKLTQITIWSNAYNSWAWFEAELTDAEGESVAEFENGVEYYKGSDWSEGSQKTRTRLKLPEGDYRLNLSMTESQIDWNGGRLASQMQASVQAGVASTKWLFTTSILFALIAAYFLGGRLLHNSRRWAGSDWSDD